MHGATQERLNEFSEWKGIESTKLPPDYYRCSNAKILDFADCLLNGRRYTQDFTEGVQEFRLNHRNQLRAYLALIWQEIRKQIKPSESIAVLVPTNKLAEDVTVGLRNPPKDSGISFPVFALVTRDDAAYDAVTMALAALHDYAITLAEGDRQQAALALCVLNGMWNPKLKAKADAIRKVTQSLEKSEKEMNSPLRQLISKLSGFEAEHIELSDLSAITSEMAEFGTTLKRMQAHFELHKKRLLISPSQPSLFEKYRSEREPKGLYGLEVMSAQTQVLTYHKAKGREFDFVLLVVEPRGEYTKAPIDESRRLYYVCTTRPKKWLGIIHFRGDPGRVLGPTLPP